MHVELSRTYGLSPDSAEDDLVELGRILLRLEYSFATVTPATCMRVNARPENAVAKSLRDVFGWSRPFEPGLLPAKIFALMQRARVCERDAASGLWRCKIRFSSTAGLLFAHSAFPTAQTDAVFFGPDSVRFARALVQHLPRARRVVDVGCGSGVGGIVLAQRGVGAERLILTDVNERALELARVNAKLASVRAVVHWSDVLSTVEGDIDLVVANPPYLRDPAARIYRDGGGVHGEALALRITKEALGRLARNPKGGELLLYTGAVIVHGVDSFLESARALLDDANARFSYEELDPDVFSDELDQPAYRDAERIAAVLLRARVAARRR